MLNLAVCRIRILTICFIGIQYLQTFIFTS